MTGNDKDDNDLNDYLNGEGGLSQAYENNAVEIPPKNVDEAILAESRKAVNSGPMRAKAPFSTHSHVPLTIAAVVVLSVLVVFNLPNESDQAIFYPSIESQSEVSTQENTFGMNRNEVVNQAKIISEDDVILENFSSDEVPSEQALVESPKADTSAFRVMRRITSDEDTSFDEYREESAVEMTQQVPESIPAINRELELTDEATPQMPAGPSRQQLEDSGTATSNSLTATAGLSEAVVTAQSTSSAECTMPRPEVCAEIYMPVCAVRDTGIRCVTTPCDSIEDVNYSNACRACSDENVFSYSDGLCESTDGEVRD
jgi:hypothetical protein